MWSSSRPLFERITQRTVVWGLAAGFALVVVLLGLAGLVAMRDSREIRKSAALLVREQLLVAHLLHEVQAEEDALALILHGLVRTSGKLDRAACLRDLEKADRAVARLAQEASRTPQAGQWQVLAQKTKAFTTTTREALNHAEGMPKDTLDQLFSSHDGVVRLIHELILLSTEHLEQTDQHMGRQLQELANESAVLLSSCFILATLCAAGTISFVRHSIRQIEWQTNELNRVSWHMLQSQEQTARRFSHELHDELGQSLAAVRANLTSGTLDDREERRADCVNLVDQAIANVRELSQLLRPVILDDFGLDAGLRWLVEKFGQRSRMRVNYDSNLDVRLDSELETHLFRIAQEALTNVARHSGAGTVRVLLEMSEGQVRLVVEDDGCGLAPGAREGSRSSLGLIGMRARARQAGGDLQLVSSQPKGLRVEVNVPVKLAEEDAHDH